MILCIELLWKNSSSFPTFHNCFQFVYLHWKYISWPELNKQLISCKQTIDSIKSEVISYDIRIGENELSKFINSARMTSCLMGSKWLKVNKQLPSSCLKTWKHRLSFQAKLLLKISLFLNYLLLLKSWELGKWDNILQGRNWHNTWFTFPIFMQTRGFNAKLVLGFFVIKFCSYIGLVKICQGRFVLCGKTNKFRNGLG